MATVFRHTSDNHTGGYNRAFFTAVWQPKFYLPRRPSAAALGQSRHHVLRPKLLLIAVAYSITAAGKNKTAAINKAAAFYDIFYHKLRQPRRSRQPEIKMRRCKKRYYYTLPNHTGVIFKSKT